MLNHSNSSNKVAHAWFPLLALCALFFASCTSNGSKPSEVAIEQVIPPSAVEKRFDEVRAIHDEVMPERGRIIRLQRKIAKSELDENVIAFAKTRLERADDMMMNWMYADIPLNKLIDSLDEKSIYQYLDDREKEIHDVSDSMMTSIRHTESILAQ